VKALRLRRELLLVVAAGCLLAAVFLALLAVDVARWRTTLPADDVRYRVSPQGSSLWSPHLLAPFRSGTRLLDVDDDLEFRRALQLVRASSLDDATVSDPNLAVRRTDAAQLLESIVATDPEPARSSRAANLLGVISLAAYNAAPEGANTQDRSELLLNAIASFEQAIELDPDNDEAKYNLQVMLARGQGLLPTEASAGRNPLPGGRGARGAGAGEPGSGY
jgi:tetratricopeptide (TPR) repeat protein